MPRTSARADLQASRPAVIKRASTSCRIGVQFLPRRREVLVTSTCSRQGQPLSHDALQMPLGQFLDELGITLDDCKMALVVWRDLNGQVIHNEGTEEGTVVH